jgi:hypothetical protein
MLIPVCHELPIVPVEVVQLFKNGYATIYEEASPSRREGREVRAGRGSM